MAGRGEPEHRHQHPQEGEAGPARTRHEGDQKAAGPRSPAGGRAGVSANVRPGTGRSTLLAVQCHGPVAFRRRSSAGQPWRLGGVRSGARLAAAPGTGGGRAPVHLHMQVRPAAPVHKLHCGPRAVPSRVRLGARARESRAWGAVPFRCEDTDQPGGCALARLDVALLPVQRLPEGLRQGRDQRGLSPAG